MFAFVCSRCARVWQSMAHLLIVLLAIIAAPRNGQWGIPLAADEPLRVALFQADVTPPEGAPLEDGFVAPVADVVDPLTARGVVLLGVDQPIVLCAVDWVGIGNGGYAAWREALARAVGTSPERVALHCVHQHDAPGCDFDSEALLAQVGLSGAQFHVPFARQAMDRVARAARNSLASSHVVTHLSTGLGRVHQVASNRRVLGEDGRVKAVRWSSTTDEAVRNEPEGLIDPDMRLVGFHDGDRTLACLTYYATHPQSHYGKGHVSWDFVGMARAGREAALGGVLHVHFNGAGGNITVGKYNDGSPDNRPRLAARLEEGMAQAWNARQLVRVSAKDVQWRTTEVSLPISPSLQVEVPLVALLENAEAAPRARIQAAMDLAWSRRVSAGRPIALACLRLGSVYILHMPGELFVEYQLAAQSLRQGDFVCMAAYGDYGPGYIGTAISYKQGGYETGPASRVAPEVEPVLMNAIGELLR